MTDVQLDETARRFIEEAAAGEIRIIANEPDARDKREYPREGTADARGQPPPADEPVLFLEVKVQDPSEFASVLQVTGEERYGYRVATGRSRAPRTRVEAGR